MEQQQRPKKPPAPRKRETLPATTIEHQYCTVIGKHARRRAGSSMPFEMTLGRGFMLSGIKPPYFGFIPPSKMNNVGFGKQPLCCVAQEIV
jgi:hypothetical protein